MMQRHGMLAAAVAILLIAAGVRLHQLDAQSLWNDEGNSLRLAERSVPDLIDAAGRDIHPPGYYLVLKGWTAAAGTSAWALRMLSALEGVLTVAVVIRLGAALSGSRSGALAGLLGGLFVALSPFAVYYSQETRMYAQLGLLSAASMGLAVWWAAAITAGHARRRMWALALALAIVNAAGLYTQYSFAFTLAAQAAWLVLVLARTPQWRRAAAGYVALNMVTLALFAPWLPTAWEQVTTWPRTGVELALDTQLRTVLTWITWGSTREPAGWIALALAIGLAGLGVTWRGTNHPGDRRRWLPAIWAAIVIGALFASGAYRPANLKFLLPAQIAVALMWGRGLVALSRIGRRAGLRLVLRGTAAAAAAMIIAGQVAALGNLYGDPAYARPDYRAMADRITASYRPGDAVILNAPNQAEVFTYYYDGPAPIYGLPRGLGGDDAAARAAVRDVLARHDRVFVLFWGEEERDPRRAVRATLDAEAFPVAAQWYGDVEFAQYAVLDAPPDRPDDLTGAVFGPVIRLAGYALSDTRARRGDVLGVTLFWEANVTPDARYQVTVQLLAPDGSLVAQHDAEPGNYARPTTTWPPGETIRDTHGLVIPPGTDADALTVIVAVYALEPPHERLPVHVNGEPSGDTFRLAVVPVEQRPPHT